MSSSKKYLKMFPWSDYHAGNIDWLLELTGAFDQRLFDVEAKNVEQDGRLDEDDVLIAGLRSDLTTETTNRVNADNALSERITSEVSARIAGDTRLQENIDAEASARQSADATLQTNIDNEATARQNGDNILQGNLTAAITMVMDNLQQEQTNRITMDEGLQAMINGEITNRTNADNAINTRIDNLPTPETVIANPSGTGTTDLAKLQVGSTIYNIPSGGGSGTDVEANPAGAATADLNKLRVGSTIYGVNDNSVVIEVHYQQSSPHWVIVNPDIAGDMAKAISPEYNAVLKYVPLNGDTVIYDRIYAAPDEVRFGFNVDSSNYSVQTTFHSSYFKISYDDVDDEWNTTRTGVELTPRYNTEVFEKELDSTDATSLTDIVFNKSLESNVLDVIAYIKWDSAVTSYSGIPYGKWLPLENITLPEFETGLSYEWVDDTTNNTLTFKWLRGCAEKMMTISGTTFMTWDTQKTNRTFLPCQSGNKITIKLIVTYDYLDITN